MTLKIFLLFITLWMGLISRVTDENHHQTNIQSEQPPVVITSNIPAIVYQRPSREAEIFGYLNPGDTITALARSDKGWIGFDPGIAQAANVGVFRLRWVDMDRSIRFVKGAFQDLPLVWTPQPGKCYNMFLTHSYLYSQSNLNSDIIDSFSSGDFAEVLQIDSCGWAYVLTISADTSVNDSGWIKPENLNLNGSCDSI